MIIKDLQFYGKQEIYYKKMILVIFIKAVAELGVIPYTHLFIS